ncbi:MAG: hypothetical protein IK031_04615 [Bacteroidales bacterium]|nr:hypothetical protein [Bacteroidales bacterium]
MRRSFILLITAALLALPFVSCEKNPGDDPGNDLPAPPDDPSDPSDTGTYKFVASPLKGTWEAGDQIYVHGNIGSWAEVITLAAGDISSDGKTATGKLGEVTGNLADPDGLYAAWPDASVKHVVSKIGSKTTFQECEGLLTAAYLDGDTFKFIDVASSLTFSVSGGYDNYAICANNRDGLIVTGFEVDHTSSATKLNQKQNSGYPFKYGTIESGNQAKVWLPGGMTLKGGITIFLAKGDKWTGCYTKEGDVKTEAGKTLDLGNISSSVKPYDGPAPKMPQITKKTKFGVRFNELSGLCLSADGDFLWGVGDDGSIAKLSFEGEVLYEKWIGCDLEAISRNPETGDLIVGIEDECNPAGSGIERWDYSGVGRIPAPNFNKVEALYEIPGAKGYDNAGIEGVTWYKDGLIFAGAQANSHFFCIKYETGEVLWDKKMYDKNLVSEIADLCYDPVTDLLWIIDSEAKKVFVMKVDADNAVLTLMGAYPVTDPSNPESVCVDHKNQCIWVGDDYGETSYLYRYDMTGLDDM